jgi:prevent-host-death family protein
MKQLNLAEAKAKLSHLVDQAAKGKGVIIAKSGVPMAKLVPLDEEKKPFKLGALDDVLTDELVAAVEAPLPTEILETMLHDPIERGRNETAARHEHRRSTPAGRKAPRRRS